MSSSPTLTEPKASAFTVRHLLMGADDVPSEIRSALAEGRARDAALLLVNQFGLTLHDACELVK